MTTLLPLLAVRKQEIPPPAEEPRRSRAVLRGLAIGAALALMALLTYGVLSQPADTTIDDAIAQGQPVAAPAFALEVLAAAHGVDGPAARTFAQAAADGRVGIEELRGTPVVLNFWASWCDPCEDEIPVLQAAWERSSGEGPLVLGLNTQDSRPDAKAFMDAFGMTYPNIREGDGEIARSYGMTGVPETFFISAQGDIVAHAIGEIDAVQLERGIAAARFGKPTPLSPAATR